MKLKLIIETVMGSREYRAPSGPQALMADFYLMELLRTGGPKYTPSHRSDAIDYEIKHVDSVLLPYIKDHMMTMVGYAIASEFSHIFDMASGGQQSNDKRSWMGYNYGEEWAKEWIDGRLPERVELALAACSVSGIPLSMQEVLPYITDIVRLAGPAFSELTWPRMYGGEPWHKACELWLNLARAKSGGDIAMAVDMIYQAQHNTGSLLNKNPQYHGIWLDHMLNLKYEANKPQDMMDMASSHVRRLASMVLRNRHGESHSVDRTITVRQKLLGDAAAILSRTPEAKNIQIDGDSVFFSVNSLGCSLNLSIRTSKSGSKGRNIYVIYSAVGPHHCNSVSEIPEAIREIDALSSNKNRIDNDPLARYMRQA